MSVKAEPALPTVRQILSPAPDNFHQRDGAPNTGLLNTNISVAIQGYRSALRSKPVLFRNLYCHLAPFE